MDVGEERWERLEVVEVGVALRNRRGRLVVTGGIHASISNESMQYLSADLFWRAAVSVMYDRPCVHSQLVSLLGGDAFGIEPRRQWFVFPRRATSGKNDSP